MHWMFLGLGLFFFLLGWLIKYRRQYWLIAGYNTATPEEQAQTDIRGLSTSLGNGLFALGIFAWLMLLIEQLGYGTLALGGLILSAPVVCLYLVFRGRKYVHSPALKKQQRTGGIVALILSAVVLIPVLIMLILGTRPAKVEVTPEAISISGMYGVRIPVQQIRVVELREQLPAIQIRTNGLGTSSVQKGHFRLEGLGQGRLFIHRNNPPFIYLFTEEGYVFLNQPDSEETRQLYQRITQVHASLPE
jgi:hypothetical protein